MLERCVAATRLQPLQDLRAVCPEALPRGLVLWLYPVVPDPLPVGVVRVESEHAYPFRFADEELAVEREQVTTLLRERCARVRVMRKPAVQENGHARRVHLAA